MKPIFNNSYYFSGINNVNDETVYIVQTTDLNNRQTTVFIAKLGTRN